MKFEDIEKIILEDKKLKKKYLGKDKKDLAIDIGLMILEARIRKGLTQAQLAKKVKTKQPAIARVERGAQLPAIPFLEKLANALGAHLVVKFEETKSNNSWEFTWDQGSEINKPITIKTYAGTLTALSGAKQYD